MKIKRGSKKLFNLEDKLWIREEKKQQKKNKTKKRGEKNNKFIKKLYKKI